MAQYSDLLQIPINIVPCTGVDGAGDKQLGAAIPATCYAEDKVQIVKDREGKEVVSNTTFYIENIGTFNIGHRDVMRFYGDDFDIKALTYIREIDGTVILWMVYV